MYAEDGYISPSALSDQKRKTPNQNSIHDGTGPIEL